MTVYRPRPNPLLMTVMGANPGGPSFIVIDSVTGRVMYTKRATGMGNEALNSCTLAAHKFARATGRSQIVFLDLSRARVGDTRNVAGVRIMGISEEIHPDGSVTRNNPVRRRRSPDDPVDTAIGEAWPRLMHGVQVPIMDIPRIFRDIKLEMAGGATLEQAILSVGSRYRVNRNPGLGAAIVGGIAGAVANRVLKNPPIQVPGDLAAACQAILRCKACWAARPYAETILRGDTMFDDPKSVLLYLRHNLAQWKGTEARIVKQVVDKYIKQGLSGFNPLTKAEQRQIVKIADMDSGTALHEQALGEAKMYERYKGMADRARDIARWYGPPRYKPNMPVASVWDRLTDRQRQWALGFAGVPERQIDYYVPRSWSTLPPRIQQAIAAGWRENPLTRGEAADTLRSARHDLRDATTASKKSLRSFMAGRAVGKAWTTKIHGPGEERPGAEAVFRRGYKTGFKKNPGGRKTTMPIAKFAQLVKNQRDPALWRDFVAKCKAYHKWSHGTWPTKVTVERVAKPGVKGLWITFDMGKQPESTYIMPKGSKRKGAWKHPWERMPQMRGDPQAGMIITKLGGGNRLTNFLHG